jgi:CRP-like cAMP-binding protein
METFESLRSQFESSQPNSPWNAWPSLIMTSRLPTARLNDALAANEVLSKLRAISKQKLLAGATFEEFERGAVICHEEAPAVRFSLVLRGEVKLVTYSTEGAALLIDIVLPNQLFGVVFHDHNPVYPCTAVTLKPTEHLSFRRKDLVEDLENNPPLQRMLLADTSQKLCQAIQMRGLWLEEARVRIAQVLLYLHERFGRVIPETRATVAELAGTSVETAIRITNRLARRGILATGRGQVQILSLAGLRDCAQGGGPAL